MVNVLIGTALGFLSGLGVGGGSLLLLWLTLGAGMAQEQARLVNLLFFLPCAAVSTALRWRKLRLCREFALPAVLAGLAGAFLGNLLGVWLDGEILRKLFGVLFLAAGVRELRAGREK